MKTSIWLMKLVIKQNLKLLQVTLKTKYGPFHNYIITTKHKYDLSVKLLVKTTLVTLISCIQTNIDRYENYVMTSSNQCMTFDIIAVITYIYTRLFMERRYPGIGASLSWWLWKIHLYFYCRVYSTFSVTNYTKIIKDTIKHQHTITHVHIKFFITE